LTLLAVGEQAGESMKATQAVRAELILAGIHIVRDIVSLYFKGLE
jgi:hypothetical protein